MNSSKIKQQKILAYILIGCSIVLIPTKTPIGLLFLGVAIATLYFVKQAEKNQKP
jgi:hypothetical protein